MPTYEYKCRDCGETLEVVQSFTDDPLTECPNCEGSLKKVFAAPGISFKGGGFYKTDSRSGNGSKKSSTSKDSDSGASSSDSSSTDSSSTSDKSSSSSDTKSSSSDKGSKKDAKASSSSKS